MDGMQILLFVVVIQTLIIIALLLVIYGQGRQLGGSYPAEVRSVLSALAGLAVFFAAQSPTVLDDTLVSTVLLPVFRLLGIDVTSPLQPPASVSPSPSTTPPPPLTSQPE